jgi:hypothetical protein
MSRLLRSLSNGHVGFWCPGCNDMHVVDTTRWTFNGDLLHPTFSPSILVQAGHYATEDKECCWCTYNKAHADNPAPFKCYRCHSYVENGIISFLQDCTHDLAGYKVPLPDFPADLYDRRKDR